MSLYVITDDFEARAEEVAPSYASRPTTRAVLDRGIEGIDRAAWAAFRAKYERELAAFEDDRIYKYGDLALWIAQKVEMAFRLGLDRTTGLDILDIGMGGGHFVYVAGMMGHHAVGTDIALPFYDDMCALLGVDRRIDRVEAGKPLPDFGRRFDLVTIVWQTFDVMRLRGGRRRYWTLVDWLGLLEDLAVNQLKAGGSIYLRLNKHLQPGSDGFHPEFFPWAEARGAVLDAPAGEIHFRDLQPVPGFFRIDGPIPAPPAVGTVETRTGSAVGAAKRRWWRPGRRAG